MKLAHSVWSCYWIDYSLTLCCTLHSYSMCVCVCVAADSYCTECANQILKYITYIHAQVCVVVVFNMSMGICVFLLKHALGHEWADFIIKCVVWGEKSQICDQTLWDFWQLICNQMKNKCNSVQYVLKLHVGGLKERWHHVNTGSREFKNMHKRIT